MHFKSVSVGSLKRMLFAFAVWDQQSEEGFTLRGFSSLRSLGPDEGSNQGTPYQCIFNISKTMSKYVIIIYNWAFDLLRVRKP